MTATYLKPHHHRPPFRPGPSYLGPHIHPPKRLSERRLRRTPACVLVHWIGYCVMPRRMATRVADELYYRGTAPVHEQMRRIA